MFHGGCDAAGSSTHLFANGLQKVDVVCVVSLRAGLSQQRNQLRHCRHHRLVVGQLCQQVDAPGWEIIVPTHVRQEFFNAANEIKQGQATSQPE